MKLTILTTDTIHHRYFIDKIRHHVEIAGLFFETKTIAAPFETGHPFEKQRDEFESQRWYANGEPEYSSMGDVFIYEDINGEDAIQGIREIDPDVGLVIGTGRLSPEVIKVFNGKLLNLHGGDPEKYRGLDSHLWSIYHRDFESIIVTLHKVNPVLDDGEIIMQAPIPLLPNMTLRELRAYNIETCLKMVVGALAAYEKLGEFIARPQRYKGRYYSFMPSVLKDICYKRFSSYTRKLT